MISVIVPSCNSERTISKTIKSLLNQDYKGKYEIIVVDKSTDKTPEIVSKFPVKLIKQKSKGISAARNLGVKKAKGKIIAFIDSDCIAPKNWLTNLLKPLSDKNVMAVSGTYKTENRESIVARFTGYEIEQRHERMKNLETIDFVGGFNCAYKKSVFLKVGGFNTNFAQSEDGELSYRVSKTGYRIKFNPSAYVYHYHPEMFNPILLFYGSILLLFSLLLTIPSSYKIFVKDKTVGILSPFIMILRDFFMGLGIVYGLVISSIESK